MSKGITMFLLLFHLLNPIMPVDLFHHVLVIKIGTLILNIYKMLYYFSFLCIELEAFAFELHDLTVLVEFFEAITQVESYY
jgi:hypothetical protein